MISMAYVNGTTSDFLYESTDSLKEMNYMESCMESLNKEWNVFETIKDNAIFEASLYDTDITENAVFTEAASDILKKIGDTVIELGKSFVKFMNKIIDAIRSVGFRRKSDVAKIESLIKLHPELKNEVVLHADELQLNDMKSLKELDKAFDEIMAMSKKKNIKPGTMRAHWEKAMKKWEDIDKKRVGKIVIGTAAVAAGVITLVTFVPKIKSAMAQSEKAVADARDSGNKQMESLAKTVETLKKNGVSEDDIDAMGRCQFALQACRMKNNKAMAVAQENQTKLQKAMDSATKKIDHFTKSDYGKNALRTTNVVHKLRDAEDDRKIDLEAKKAAKVELARKEASLKFDQDNAKDIQNLEINKLRATRDERMDFEKEKALYQDDIKKMAKSSRDYLDDMENRYAAKKQFDKNHPKKKYKLKGKVSGPNPTKKK